MISALRFSPSRTFVQTRMALPSSVAFNQRIRAVALSTIASQGAAFQCKQTFSHHNKPIQSLAADSQGKFLISGCAAGKIVLQDLHSRGKPVVLNEEEKGKNEVTFVGYLPAQKLFVGCMAYGTMTLWTIDGDQTKLGSHLRRIQRTFHTFRSIWFSTEQITHLGDVNGMIETFCPHQNRPMVVSASQDATIKAWDPQKPEAPLFHVGTHQGMIYDLVTCNENRIASASEDGTIKLWKPFFEKDKGQLSQTLTHSGRVLKLLFLSEQNTLVSRNESNDGSTIKAWDLSDVETTFQVGDFESSSRSLEVDKILSLAAFPDGTLVLGYQNGEIRLWNYFENEKNPVLSTLPQKHRTGVRALAVLVDGSLISGGEDGMIHRWVRKTSS